MGVAVREASTAPLPMDPSHEETPTPIPDFTPEEGTADGIPDLDPSGEFNTASHSAFDLPAEPSVDELEAKVLQLQQALDEKPKDWRAPSLMVGLGAILYFLVDRFLIG